MGVSAATKESYWPPTDVDSVGLTLVFRNGNVWNSRDRGATWDQLISPVGANLSDVLGNTIAGTFYFDNKVYAVQGGVNNPDIAYTTTGTNWYGAGTLNTSTVSAVTEVAGPPAVVQNGNRCLFSILSGSRFDSYSIPSVLVPSSTTVFNPIISDDNTRGPASDGNQRVIFGSTSTSILYSTNGGNSFLSGSATYAPYSAMYRGTTAPNFISSTPSFQLTPPSTVAFRSVVSNTASGFGSWSTQSTSTNNPFRGRGGYLYCPQPANAQIQGGFALVLETLNQLSGGVCTTIDGITWTRHVGFGVNNNTNDKGVAVWAMDRALLMYCGTGGSSGNPALWSTLDRGNTWNTLTLPESSTPTGLTYQG